MNLVKKFELIEKYKPDIAIIQECEKLDKSYFPNSEYWWIGKDEKRDWVLSSLTNLLKFQIPIMKI